MNRYEWVVFDYHTACYEDFIILHHQMIVKKNKKDTQTVCRRLTTNFTELETKYNKISSNKTVQHQQIKTNKFKLVLGEEAQGLESKSGQNS